MTLCLAWIKKTNDNQELIFATDSMLTGGGEVWKHGVKLFDLPRNDCLLCFAGDTDKAYPLILNAISSIKFDISLINQHNDIRQVLEYICDIFTELINRLQVETTLPTEDTHASASFIFGGWNWKLKLLEFWEIYYSLEEKKFLYIGNDSSDSRPIKMIGDYTKEAQNILIEELEKVGKKIEGEFDMEPLRVLSKMSRDTENFRSIDGSLQIAKVYSSGTSEFFGVMWPSIEGKYTFLGRELNPYLKPQIRFIDPDSVDIIDFELPKKISFFYDELKLKIDKTRISGIIPFIEDCYPNDEQKPDLTEKEKEMLHAIFKDNSYKGFLKSLSDIQAENIGDKENGV